MKSKFNNPVFYWIIITIFGGLLLFDIYSLITHYAPILFLAVAIQSILLMLIFTKHKYVKIGIIIWSLIVLIIGNSIHFLSLLLKFIGMKLQEKYIDFTARQLQDFIIQALQLFLGILIFRYAYKTIVLVKKEENENSVANESEK